MKPTTCPTRDNGSPNLNDPSRGLVLVNWFGDLEGSGSVCTDNQFTNLQSKLQTCFAAAGDRWANFLAVDFFEVSDGLAFWPLIFLR
jgi:hypothetical protein